MRADECETCGGTGETFVDAMDRRGEHVTVEIDCPYCVDQFEREVVAAEDETAREVETERREQSDVP